MTDRQAILVILLLLALVALAIWLVVIPWVKRGPRGEIITGLIWRIVRTHCRLVHRVRFHGLREFRDQMQSGPLIVVSNHTGAVDPLLIQAGCRFHIRWMMASDMMNPSMNWLWRREEIIPVARDGRDSTAAREAIRHIKQGGAVGIFPEGRIVLPPRQIRPFYSGVGLMIARTRAPVLLVWVSGTPDTTQMSESIFSRSRARVEFLELIDFGDERDPNIITQKLRERLAAASGWPLIDVPMPPRA